MLDKYKDRIDPDDDWDGWDIIEAEFGQWLEDNPMYMIYTGSNAMIHFLREYYSIPEPLKI